MKLRIKGNSIRYRLTKTEVGTLANSGYLEEQTCFLDIRFIYALKTDSGITELSATYSDNKITLFVPVSFVKEWAQNNVVGCDATMPVTETGSIYLLLEKDFVCLDENTEDQSDNFENPNKNC